MYKGHKNKKFKIPSTLDSAELHVVTGSENGRIYFWDLVQAKPVYSFQAHEGSILCLCIFEDTLITSGDSTIKVWKPRTMTASTHIDLEQSKSFIWAPRGKSVEYLLSGPFVLVCFMIALISRNWICICHKLMWRAQMPLMHN